MTLINFVNIYNEIDTKNFYDKIKKNPNFIDEKNTFIFSIDLIICFLVLLTHTLNLTSKSMYY